MLFVDDTFAVLQYTIENVSHIGPYGVVIDISCSRTTRIYTIYAYAKLEDISIYPVTHLDDISMDVMLLLNKIHKEANLSTKELQHQLGCRGVWVQLNSLEDLQKWRLRCRDTVI